MLRWIFAASIVLVFSADRQAYACVPTSKLEERNRKYDLNGDGCIDARERDLLRQDLAILDREEKLKPPKLPKPPAPELVPYKPVPFFIVRDAYPVNAVVTNDEKISDAGALVSYTHDRIAKEWTLALKGAVAAGVAWDRELTNGIEGVSRVAFMAGAEFDRGFQNNSANTGSASAKAGFELEYFNANALFLRQYFRADAVYTTDYDGKASLFGFEGSWQPMSGNDGYVGKTTAIAWDAAGRPRVWWEFRPTLAVDYFHVADNGVFKALKTGEDYLWAGLKLKSSLIVERPLEWLFPDLTTKAITLEAKYFYLYETLSGRKNQNIDYLQLTASYPIIGDFLFAQVRYTNGNSPRTLVRQDDVYAGLTIKIGDYPTSPTSAPVIEPSLPRGTPR